MSTFASDRLIAKDDRFGGQSGAASWRARAGTLLGIGLGAGLLRLVTGVGFANYDTLYALVWGQQLSRLQTPQYGISIAPTPHPLIELLGLALAPLGASATEQITVALGFIALAGCAWAIYKLGAFWFGRAAGLLAALILITRGEILSYGVRAYIDVPYLLFILVALLVESRRPRAGAPVLALLALAGLLRPEAWVFSGLYWLYLLLDARGGHSSNRGHARTTGYLTSSGRSSTYGRSRNELLGLALLAAAAPLAWILSDWLITGHPLWSLTNTKATAKTLGRKTGIGNVPEYLPRRIGEILRPPVLVGAALGGVLTLALLKGHARLLAIAGVISVIVLGAFTAVGLPLDTRYAFLASAILCVFCGAGVFGWTQLKLEDPRRRWWMLTGLVVLLGLIAYMPSQYESAHHQLGKLERQQQIEGDLVALVKDGAIVAGCGDVGVPNHAPIPLLALYLKVGPKQVVSAAEESITTGTYLDPATKEVEENYILDTKDPHVLTPTIPSGFIESHANRSWLVFKHCS